jgi:hypothetical protein
VRSGPRTTTTPKTNKVIFVIFVGFVAFVAERPPLARLRIAERRSVTALVTESVRALRNRTSTNL